MRWLGLLATHERQPGKAASTIGHDERRAHISDLATMRQRTSCMHLSV
jgi:hypothetical protein